MTLTNVPTELIDEIKTILAVARQKAATAVNFAMVEAYWLMGKRIVEEEQNGANRAQYGEGIITMLSRALVAEFGKGFSVANLRNFRQFYLVFQGTGIRYAVTAQSNTQTVHDFIKDPYVFEFLNMTEPYSANERTLETALINHLQRFLLELGKGFSFVGRQFRISTETSHFYIDLVFYNYILKCFVLFDLKTSKLKHQDIGQMDMYIRMFDDLQKQPDDNPTIGIILCADKEETVVKYSILNDSEQMFASQYRLYLPTEAELKQLLENDRIVFALNQADQGSQL